VGGRDPQVLSRRILVEIVQPRVEEIFDHARRELVRSGFFDSIPAGVVVTGGSTIMEGFPELAEDEIGLPTRRGAPRDIGGLVDVVRSPEFATGVGLVRYGLRSQGTPARAVVYQERGGLRRALSWLGEMF
jgi:cell division protein FtsA